jgi:hypothetical protein
VSPFAPDRRRLGVEGTRALAMLAGTWLVGGSESALPATMGPSINVKHPPGLTGARRLGLFSRATGRAWPARALGASGTVSRRRLSGPFGQQAAGARKDARRLPEDSSVVKSSFRFPIVSGGWARWQLADGRGQACVKS